MIRKFHPFFLLNIRPWPLLIRFNAFSILFSFILFIKFSLLNCFVFRIFNTTISCFLWWILYRGEFNLEGKTSMNLEQGLKFSIILFISSEIFFFFSFFWSYFHFFLSPTIETGLIWPPYRVVIFNCLNAPHFLTLGCCEQETLLRRWISGHCCSSVFGFKVLHFAAARTSTRRIWSPGA